MLGVYLGVKGEAENTTLPVLPSHPDSPLHETANKLPGQEQ